MCSKVSKKRLTLTNMKPGAAATGTALGLEALLQGQPDAAAPAGKGAAGATWQPLPRRGSLCQKRLPMLQDRTCREKVAFSRRECRCRSLAERRRSRKQARASALGQLGVGLGLEPLDVHYETLMGPFADYSFGVPGDDLEHQAASVDLDQF